MWLRRNKYCILKRALKVSARASCQAHAEHKHACTNASTCVRPYPSIGISRALPAISVCCLSHAGAAADGDAAPGEVAGAAAAGAVTVVRQPEIPGQLPAAAAAYGPNGGAARGVSCVGCVLTVSILSGRPTVLSNSTHKCTSMLHSHDCCCDPASQSLVQCI